MNTLDFTHEVLNGLDSALVEQAAQTPKRRLPYPVRTGLVAACLCVALLGMAMAAGELMKGTNVQEYFSGMGFTKVMQKIDRMYRIVPGDEDAYSGYVIPWEGGAVPLEHMSAEVQELLRKSQASGTAESVRFGSVEKLENFMGLALYENTVLDALEQRAQAENLVETVYDAEGNPLEYHNEVVGAVLHCMSDADGRNRVDFLRFCGLNNGAWEIVVTTEILGYPIEDSNGTAYVFVDGTQFSEEVYVTTTGEEVTIIRCDIPENCENAPDTQYTAHFYVQGVRYEVCILCMENPDEGGALMKEILDAFTFYEF